VTTKRAVFVDKDGTLVDDVPYNVDPALVRLAAGASEGVAALSHAGYEVFVVSNQPGVAMGLFDEEQLGQSRSHLEGLFHGTLSGFYYCPHHADAGCRCRKPSPGLLLRAAREHGVSLRHSWMIGDILDDVEAGRRAGCRTVLIDNGNETEWQLGGARRPDCIVADLSQAAALILAE
jgi:histidinol-phosphate phosphatase family protein